MKPAAILTLGFIVSSLTTRAEPLSVDGSVDDDIAALRSAVFRKACTSVAQVNYDTEFGIESGCGFFIDSEGTLATVLGTLEDADALKAGRIKVGYGGKEFAAHMLAVDPFTRLALLKLDNVNVSPAVELGQSARLEVGDHVFAVNHATDVIEQCLTGRLSGREKDFKGATFAISVLRLNISGGEDSFGAPVLDRDGKVCGVLLVKVNEQHGAAVSYALPVEVLHKVINDFRKHGHVEQSWLGLGMEAGTTTPEIRMLTPESPAEKAGLEVGDILFRIGDRKVGDYQDVVDACYYLTPDEGVSFDVLRGLRDVRVTVVPVSRASRPGHSSLNSRASRDLKKGEEKEGEEKEGEAEGGGDAPSVEEE